MLEQNNLLNLFDGRIHQAPMRQERGHTKFHFGRIWCGRVRDFLREQRLLGWQIEWVESSGVFSRSFTISGPVAHVEHVGDILIDWCRRLNESKER